MPKSDLPSEIQHRIWQTYFSEYVLKNISHARWAYKDSFCKRQPDWIYESENNPLGNPPPATGKFAWAHDTGSITNYQEVDEWTDYDPF